MIMIEYIYKYKIRGGIIALSTIQWTCKAKARRNTIPLLNIATLCIKDQ